MMTGLGSDIRQAVRSFARAPVFTATTVVTLALGVGAVVAIFTVVNAVLLEPLPFRNERELVSIYHTAPGFGFDRTSVALNQWATYRTQSRVFEEVAAWAPGAVTVTERGEPERMWSMSATWELLPMLGVEPFMGRSFSPQDDSPDGPETVMLSHGYWRRAFGGSPDAIGASLTVDGRPRTIIGVLPEEFEAPQQDVQIVLPFRWNRERIVPTGFNYEVIARLKHGVTIDQANADVDRMIPLATELYGGTPVSILEDAGFAAAIQSLRTTYVGDVGRTLWVLLGSVGFLLLIACANAVNLVLVRMEGRLREIAVRSAIGAGTARIGAQLLLESVVLALMGGLLGVVLASAGVQVLVRFGPEDLPRLAHVAVDPGVLWTALGVSVLAGCMLAVLPMLRSRRIDLGSAMKEGGRGGLASRERHRARHALAESQLALALVLLVGSGLMLRSLRALQAVNPGFTDPEQVVTFRLAVPPAEIVSLSELADTYERMASQVGDVPGVTSVTVASSLTMEGFTSNDAVRLEDFPLAPGQAPEVERIRWIMGDYFETMQIPLVAGRAIERSDIRDRSPVAVVSRGFAEEHWGDADGAIGRRITGGDPDTNPTWHEIVGVVEDVRDNGVDQEATPLVYWPVAMSNFYGPGIIVPRGVSFAVRTAGDTPTSLMPAIRAAIAGVNPNIALARVSTLDRILSRSMARTSFTMAIMLIATAVAVALGLVGLYGVVAYVVGQRTREIGLRMALGAEQSDVRRMVLRHSLTLAVVGVVLGIAAALVLTPLMASLLYGVDATDPLTFGVVAVSLTAVTLLASYLPARRAARIDPLVALRSE